MNILILSCGTRNKIVQYFRETFAGSGNVIATDMSPYAPAIFEADKYYLVPRITEPDYIPTVLDICRKEKISGILSLIDPELSLLALHRKEFEALGIVKGTVVQSKNFGKDFMAGMKTLVGGEIRGYTEMLNEARQIATKRMVDEALAWGADAVINVRYGSSAVMQGAAEVIAYGTAVKYK